MKTFTAAIEGDMAQIEGRVGLFPEGSPGSSRGQNHLVGDLAGIRRYRLIAETVEHSTLIFLRF
jgi:hypothetical protein